MKKISMKMRHLVASAVMMVAGVGCVRFQSPEAEIGKWMREREESYGAPDQRRVCEDMKAFGMKLAPVCCKKFDYFADECVQKVTMGK